VNTPNNKALEVRRTNKKFRRLANAMLDTGAKVSSRLVGRAYWGAGLSRKDFPKSGNMEE
jgi:hypothetical protein